MTLKFEQVVKDRRIFDIFKTYAEGQKALPNFLFLTGGGNAEHLYKTFIDSKSRSRILLSASELKTLEVLAKKKGVVEAVKKAKETISKSMNSHVEKFEATDAFKKFLKSKDEESNKTLALLSVITETLDVAIAYFETTKTELATKGIPAQRDIRARMFTSGRMRNERVVACFQDRLQKDKKFNRTTFPELFKKKDTVLKLWGEVAKMIR